MKIHCDVCEKGEASVFCVADEAALCAACDHRVHHANKLAGKHHRFSLLLPSPKQLPVCDICQERRAFVFCQQDRAILCRECDIPIHKANEHTLKHNRFLLTGIKLSATSALYSSPPEADSFSNVSVAVPNLSSKDSANKAEIQKSPKSPITYKDFSVEIGSTATPESKKEKGSNGNGQIMMNGGTNGLTSSISDHLGDMLPDWHVEDFLDPFSPLVFSKSGGSDGNAMPFWDSPDLAGNNENSYSPKSIGDWVPQAEATTAISPVEIQPFSTWNMGMAAFGGQISFKQNKDMLSFKGSRKWTDDNSFAVPQTNTSASNKRFRAFW